MSKKDKKEPLIRFLDIAFSILKRTVKTIGRMLFVLTILSIIVLVLGGILSAVVTIVVLLDNPGASLIECFWEYYIRNFKLLIKVFGIIAVVLFMVVPVRVFFDD